MGKVLFGFLLILLFCAPVFAQKGEKIMCPYVDVAVAPQGARVGEMVTFRAEVDTEGKKYELKYHWYVTEAIDPRKSVEIVSGQGTPVITVVQVKGSVKATLEIGGFPDSCQQANSQIAYVDPSPADRNCPGIEFIGPAKSVKPGKLVEYIVHVETGGEEIKLEYIWAAVYKDAETGKRKIAEIVSGQDTPRAKFRMPGEDLTVSVIIGGIPEGCPMMASETVRVSLLPTEVLLEDFRGPLGNFDKARTEKIRAALRNHPGAILYVFVGYKTAKSAKGAEKQAFVLKKFSNYSRYSIVFSNVDDKGDILQIWLVKNGTRPPKFEGK